MPKIFLSYAEEDGKIAREIAKFLRTNLDDGWEICYWEDPRKRGQRWIDKIEKDILESNAFLALISPHYQTSPWCIHERNMALQRDVEYQRLEKQFLWVAKVGPIDKVGFLSNYDWIDPLGPEWVGTLEEDYFEGLNQMENVGKFSPIDQKEPSNFPTFENRREELDDLIGNLTNVAGKHFWLFLSAPQMGKSWLLERLPIELTERDPNWQIVTVDLREQPLDARSNLAKLLSVYFKKEFQKAKINTQIVEYTKEIVKKNTRLLLILDSAELLSDDTAKALRECLSNIYRLLEETRKKNVRLAFVAASRRQIPSWRSVIPTPPFISRTLSHFPISVIEAFLRKMARMDEYDLDNRWFRTKSQQLSRASKGLPGLLVIYMDWIRKNAYIIKPRIESLLLFALLAKPYVVGNLLSSHSLLPSSPDPNLIEPRRALLGKILLGLSIYRCFTEKYFHQFLDENYGLLDELKKTEWTRDQLWASLQKTYLMEPTLDIWIRLYSSIRRLLFHYQNPSHDKQVEAHQKAIAFYNNNQITLSGTDKAIVLIEQLWHQAEYQRLSNPKSDPSSLVDFACDLFKNGIQSNHHTDRDLGVLIDERLHNDQELQESLAEIEKDLFNKIISIISQYIS